MKWFSIIQCVVFGIIAIPIALYEFYANHIRPFPICVSEEEVRNGNLLTLTEGTVIAHNKHLKCVRNGLLGSLREAATLAANEGLLLVVYLHSDLNDRSQNLLREIISVNTGQIQSVLESRFVFYLLSCFSREASLLPMGFQGAAYPTLLVYSCITGNNEQKSSDVISHDITLYKKMRFVGGIEGVGTVTDMRKFLETCELRYTSIA